MNLNQLSKMITPEEDGTPTPYLRTAVVVSTGATWVISLDGVDTPATALSGVVAVVGDNVQVLTKLGAPPLILGAVNAGNRRTPVLLETIGLAGTTAGTNVLTVAAITVPAQGVPGQVQLRWHGGYFFCDTMGDSFEVFGVEGAGSVIPIGGIRHIVPSATGGSGLGNAHGTIDWVDSANDGTVAVDYLIKAQRTAGIGTATFFNDGRYNRLSALWVPA